MNAWQMCENEECLQSGNKFVCERCIQPTKEIMKPNEEVSFCDRVELRRSFCNWRDTLNANGGGEAAVTAQRKIGWVKFNDRVELLH